MASLGKLGPGVLRALALAVVGVLVIAALMTLRGGTEQKTLDRELPAHGVDLRRLATSGCSASRSARSTTVEPAGTTVKVTMDVRPRRSRCPRT